MAFMAFMAKSKKKPPDQGGFIMSVVALFNTEGLLHLGNIIQLLPGKQLDLSCHCLTIGRDESLFHHLRLTAHMTIGSRLAVDRITQLEPGFDEIRPHIEQFRDLFGDLAIGQLDLGRAIGIDVDAGGLCHADSIRNLHQHFVGNAGSYEVLGDMTGSISSGTVHLGRIFTAESAAAMAPLPP
jgi:hypothetical protein